MAKTPQTPAAIERLLERLQTGWTPKTDEIDHDIMQRDLLNWAWDWDAWNDVGFASLIGQNIDRQVIKTGLVLWITEDMGWALCEDGFWWLYTAEEGEKMRYLGG